MELPPGSLPSLHAFERGPLVRPVGIVLAQNRECFDARQHRERRDLTGAADRPYRLEAKEAAPETALETFPDHQAFMDMLAGVESLMAAIFGEPVYLRQIFPPSGVRKVRWIIQGSSVTRWRSNVTMPGV